MTAGRIRTAAIALVAITAAAVLAWAGIDALGTPSANCDNVAGECLRGRQEAALFVFAAISLIAAGALLWAAARLLRGGSRSRQAVIVAAAGALLAAGVLVVKPADHLDHRYEGWLAAGPVLSATHHDPGRRSG